MPYLTEEEVKVMLNEIKNILFLVMLLILLIYVNNLYCRPINVNNENGKMGKAVTSYDLVA